MSSSTGFYMHHWSRPITILLIFIIEWSFRGYILNHVPNQTMWSRECFSSAFLLPQFFLWMWVVFFLISSSGLSWVIALLLVEKSIKFNCVIMYHSLCTVFSWLFSFCSASIPGGLSSSHGIPPVHYFFQHNSIPSSSDTIIYLAIPQLKDIPLFFSFLPPQRVQL